MRRRNLNILFIISCFLLAFLFPAKILAVGFTLTEPSGPFTQGQEVQFIINIDTQGKTITSAETDLNYDTEYLEYVSAAAGTLLPNLSSNITSTGTLHLSASVSSESEGVTGTGVFATVTFRLIGNPQSEVELCALATPTPTSAPATPGQPTTQPQPTSPPVVTAPPVETLPRSGVAEGLIFFTSLGIILTSTGIGLKKLQG